MKRKIIMALIIIVLFSATVLINTTNRIKYSSNVKTASIQTVINNKTSQLSVSEDNTLDELNKHYQEVKKKFTILSHISDNKDIEKIGEKIDELETYLADNDSLILNNPTLFTSISENIETINQDLNLTFAKNNIELEDNNLKSIQLKITDIDLDKKFFYCENDKNTFEVNVRNIKGLEEYNTGDEITAYFNKIAYSNYVGSFIPYYVEKY